MIDIITPAPLGKALGGRQQADFPQRPQRKVIEICCASVSPSLYLFSNTLASATIVGRFH
jgi:hypothetical protein